MKPLPSRAEAFWLGVIAGIISALAFLPAPAKTVDAVQVRFGSETPVCRST